MESEGETGGKSLKNLGVQVCQICGDNVGTRAMQSEGETGGKSLKNLGVQVCQICGDNVGTRAMESEGETGGKSLKNLGVQVCQICGDNVGTTAKGDPFVACDVCAFPVCRPCYEYERKDGNQCCPQCKTRYKRHKGSHSRAKQRERGRSREK